MYLISCTHSFSQKSVVVENCYVAGPKQQCYQVSFEGSRKEQVSRGFNVIRFDFSLLASPTTIVFAFLLLVVAYTQNHLLEFHGSSCETKSSRYIL
jgi:hypothetical protein